MPAGGAPFSPALSIKIDNAPLARPQSGLNDADIVYECLVEGGLSRFLAVYNSTGSPSVGPIRSARPVDGALLRALNGGIFAYSGAATGEIAPAKEYSTALLLSNDNDPRPFYRQHSRRPPENVYATTDSLRREAAGRSSQLRTPPPIFAFGPAPAGSVPASTASVRIGGAASALWRRVGKQYLRWENGTAHLLVGGDQVRATNVVVLHVQVTGSGIVDAAGNEDPFVRVVGRGVAEVLRDGVLERGTWSRPSVAAPYRFTSPSGKVLTLARGNTWVELVPTSGSATFG